MLKAGDALPVAQVLDHEGKTISTKDLLGKPLVVFFYPKADTPGCTSECKQFRDLYEKILATGARIVGVSRDTPDAQKKFKEKYELPFRLLADTDSKLCDAFGVIVEKNMYGIKKMGLQRSTFLFDEHGKVVHAWPKVSVEGHADDVVRHIPVKVA
jgi:peroxiredoxin Q/BCP